ncbi:MAG: SAM hydrolase/SAM-dependent halogenase family protein [Acidimicrobiales bacterium]
MGVDGRVSVSFLSDFGSDDEFVGVVHSVIASLSPASAIVDLLHRVPPHDVTAGALALWRCAPFLAPGVALAVVDPGVGTSRRAVAIAPRSGGTLLVGPDNGLLAAAAARLGGVAGAVAIEPERVALPWAASRSGSPAPPAPRSRPDPAGWPDRAAPQLSMAPLAGEVALPGPTFAGRDVFAPAAAILASAGARQASLCLVGDEIDPAGLVPCDLPPAPSASAGSVEASVLWVDGFGNIELNLPFASLPAGETLSVAVNGQAFKVRKARAYGELAPGEMGLVTDSQGLVALCLNGASAAGFAAARRGDRVVLRPAVP